MYNYKVLEYKIRECYKCGKKMLWASFMIGWHNKVQRENFTHDELCEIWGNDIYIIQCCDCFFGKRSPLEEIERLANVIKERKKIARELVSW